MHFSHYTSNNGQLFPASQPLIALDDRGFLFGDGVFTTVLVREGIPENLTRHMERLKRDCSALKITFPLFDEYWVRHLIEANQAEKGTWRLKILISAGNSKVLRLHQREGQHVFMTLEGVEKKKIDFCHLTLYPEPVVMPIARIKSLASLNRFFIKEFALEKGTFDALTTDCKGYILEASYSNIFWVKGNIIYTPSFDLPLLRGIFLEVLLEKMHEKKMSIVEVHARLDEIPTDAYVFICNSIMGAQPVDSIDERQFLRNESLVLG